MFELQFFLIGIIQGVTEFLPISSSGHLVLFAQLTNWEDQGLFTDIAVHFGTLFAVVIYLRKDIYYFFTNIFQFKIFEDQIIFKIILATLPAIILGYFIYDYVSLYFRSIQLIALSSIVFAIILFFADRVKMKSKSWNKITYKEALVVGLFQVLAFIPGASRAGVTITGARLLGYDRLNAARFSMILSIPIILASMTLSLINVFKDEYIEVNFYHSFSAAIIAFITALLSITFLMNFIKKFNFNIFIIYRILLGVLLLLLLFA
ncbi:undecaprenyl-diphosphate phosphatase [Alphaproteobacteria bacterium]|nr:undecaprenyl-diphosphate phosphatase [Alphaproteobacteria bacterium]